MTTENQIHLVITSVISEAHATTHGKSHMPPLQKIDLAQASKIARAVVEALKRANALNVDAP